MKTSLSHLLLKKDILLESGTNELEVLVFKLADYTFGINVAKVREILPSAPITSLAQTHPSVLGVMKLREMVVPVVSLRRHLQVPEIEPSGDQTLILADFNAQQTAFVVDRVERIHRLSWEQILAVPAISSLSHSPVTAVARLGERLVIMLDFEMIVDQVTQQNFRTAAIANPQGLARGELRVLVVDDSATVRAVITDTLLASGYSQVRTFSNGHEAWTWLAGEAAAGRDLASIADLLISDVEMPQVDGLHLTKLVKSHPQLQALPVLLYSSIVTPDNLKKGQAVGADAQIAKPNVHQVVEVADGLIAQAIERRARTHAPPNAPGHALQAEQAPIWEVEEESPAADNPRLWQTYRIELADRSRHFARLLAQLSQSPDDAATGQELLRTLHIIRSAALVVPVPEVVRWTQMLETQLAPHASQPASWPMDRLATYGEWLQNVATLETELPAVLAQGRQLCERMTLPC